MAGRALERHGSRPDKMIEKNLRRLNTAHAHATWAKFIDRFAPLIVKTAPCLNPCLNWIQLERDHARTKVIIQFQWVQPEFYPFLVDQAEPVLH